MPRPARVALSPIVLALRIRRPIQREPIAYQPLRKVNTSNRASRNCSPVLIQAHGRAIDRPPRNEGVKLVCCLRAASVLQAIIAATELSAFGRVNAPQANALTVHFERVAGNHGLRIAFPPGRSLASRSEPAGRAFSSVGRSG